MSVARDEQTAGIVCQMLSWRTKNSLHSVMSSCSSCISGAMSFSDPNSNVFHPIQNVPKFLQCLMTPFQILQIQRIRVRFPPLHLTCLFSKYSIQLFVNRENRWCSIYYVHIVLLIYPTRRFMLLVYNYIFINCMRNVAFLL